MKAIRLKEGKVILLDDEDYDLLSRYKWHACKSKHTYYAERKVGGKTVLMHRQILGLQYKDGKITDHIDGNGLNNQRSNIRCCSMKENNRNRRKIKTCSSQYKGVHFHKGGGNWQVNIKVNGKRIYLGCHKNEEVAGQIYDDAAIKYHGEFAITNFPLPGR